MLKSFGNTAFQNNASATGNRLRLADGPIELGWHHCSTTADFLGDFYALRLAPSPQAYNEMRHGIGYLVNELLENAVKFRSPGDILIESSLEAGRFEIKVVNLVDEKAALRFQEMLAEITTRDPGDLLIERIEANAADADSSGSGLGLLTLMNDYDADLGWQFDAQTGGRIRLETFAALDFA